MKRLLAVALAAIAAGCSEPALMSAGDLKPTTARPDATLRYGVEPSQFVELWRAVGPGDPAARPVVALIHGGCWQAQYGLDLMRPMAHDLSQRGFNVWNIEYRRIGELGGGYPGTFQDVSAALDGLRGQQVDLSRLVVVGHSAGGHLALWASARPKLPEGSSLRPPDPLPIPAVLSLGGVGDLKAAAADPTFSGACGKETIPQLVGEGQGLSNPYADTSPVNLPNPAVTQVMLHGAREQITPAALGEAYAAKISATGGRARAVSVPGAGHFEVISPGTPAWSTVVAHIAELSRSPP